MSLSRILYQLFFESSVAYAEGYVNGSDKVGYKTIAEIPTLEIIQEHLDQLKVLGAYTINPDNTVKWAAWDIDSHAGIEEARKLTKKLSEFLEDNGIEHTIEFSGNKGYHVDLFFEEKESAEEVKQAMCQIRDSLGLPKSGDPHVEIFPKQGSLSKTNPYGNLLRLPLGMHPKTKKLTFFVDTEKWEEGDALDPEIELAKRTTLADLKKAIVESDVFTQIVDLLSPYWVAGQRHDITLSLSGYLASVNWSQDETIALVEAIHALVPDGDLEDQIKAVESTYKKYYAGEKIIGVTGLGAAIPAADLNTLMILAGKSASPTAMLSIDRIRLGKGAPFLKVRSAGNNIVSNLIESGRLVRDHNDIYWLDRETHNLTTFGTVPWTRHLHNFFGVNVSENFGRQVLEAIKHISYDKAKEVKVKRRSHWENGVQYINLGGPEIYVLSGDRSKREVIYNGEIDILFKNSEDRFHLPNLMTSGEPTMSPWPFLTDDVNFKEGEEGTTSEQQRELFKAFFISTFFSEMMPTKPILTILADSGFGKTTTARRMLRLLEGPDSDVLTLNDDKPDSFRASLAAHRFMVLDNLELSTAKWLADALNRASTGAHIELRELHTTNTMRREQPNCSIVLTATKMPFSEETVYTRMLPVELGPVMHRRSEYLIQADLINNFNSLWKGILDVLDDAVAELNSVTSVDVPNDVRLADFAVFCNRIKGSPSLDKDILEEGMKNLTNRQKNTLEKNSPFIEVVSTMMQSIPSGDTGWLSMSELYARGQKTANLVKLEWRWTTVQALSKHVLMLEPQLIQHFGLSTRVNKSGGRDVKQYRFVRKILKVSTDNIERESEENGNKDVENSIG